MTRRTKVFATLGLAAVLGIGAVALPGASTQTAEALPGLARNIILMVPDGMGLADVTATRIYLNGLGGAPLWMETLPQIGYQRTWAANSTVPDSAAAASAWACGEKINNDVICMRPDGTYPLSVLELAERLGKATGLVATSTITHATPAAFGAHAKSRKCEPEIARQYIQDVGVDVILGDGRKYFNATSPDICQTAANGADFIETQVVPRGHKVVSNSAELDAAVSSGARRLLGLFKDPINGYGAADGMTPEYARSAANTEPHLWDMTAAALDVLEKDRDGFFLMVEGSQIDWADHANNLDYQLGEMAAFDQSVKVVLDWVNSRADRRAHTLVVIVADHETGGFAISGPYGSLTPAGGKVQAGWTSKEHTGVDTIVWSMGPGSTELGRALDNTDLFGAMVRAARLDR